MVEAVRPLFEGRDNPFLDTDGRWLKLLNLFDFLRHASPQWLWKLNRYRKMPAKEFIAHFLKGPRLKGLLGNMGYRGWTAFQMALAWYFWLEDYWYPKGGVQAFSNLLAQTFTSMGGNLRYNTRVNQILVEGGKAVGISTEDNKLYRVKFIVSGVDYLETMTQLLDKEHLEENEKGKLQKAEPSESFFTVYLGLDMPTEELKGYMRTHHIFLFQGYQALDFSARDDPYFHKKTWLELSSPSIGDTSLAPSGKSSLIIQSFSLYDWMERWGTGPNGERTPQYQALKEAVANDLIKATEKIIPGLSSRIIHKVTATPLTHESFTLNTRGASVG